LKKLTHDRIPLCFVVGPFFAPFAKGAFKWPKLIPDLEPKAPAVQLRLGALYEQTASPAHRSPVVFVGGSASQADLIMTSVVVDARPREAVRATLAEKKLQQFHGFT
jgi:hypothetical protein